MKNIGVNHYTAQIFLAFILLILLLSCSEERNNFQRERNADIELLGAALTELKTLKEGAKYGPSKGYYPEESKEILDDAMAELGRLIIKIDGGETVSQSEIEQSIVNADNAIKEFQATIRTENLVYPAELYVNGQEGGYIDFGNSDEYLSFGDPQERAFTVELWVKLTSRPDGIGSVVSTFVENGGIRRGWMLNIINGNFLRMTYAKKAEHGLWEPGNGFNDLGKWSHIAAVYDDNGVDGEMENGYPVVAKYYVDGVLKSKIVRGDGAEDYYGGNDNNLLDLPMIAFAQFNIDGSLTRKSQGYIKHFHIWKSAKSEQELNSIMNNPQEVTGDEPDLVCGWPFNTTVEDSQNIKDLTGRHTAEIKGGYEWQLLP